MADSLMGKKSQLELVVMEQEPEKQGIVSILCSDKSGTSLRRTLSADMSSRKWLSRHGFSPMMKRIASSDELSHCLYEEEEEVKEKKKEVNAGQFDIWSSILSEKDKDVGKDSVTYIHPLVKRSASGLSEKSLEVCTESLGSETGAETFSSYPSSESGADSDEEPPQQQQQKEQQYEDVVVVKYNFTPAGKKLPPAAFPPALPSRRMTPRRENGRLVLEAVTVTAENNFKAERQDGRLVLTYLKEAETDQQVVAPPEKVAGELEDCFGSDHSDEEEEETEDEDEIETELEITTGQESKSKQSGRVIELHRLALMMNKPASLTTRNSTWAEKPNEQVPATPAHSLPPRPPRLTAAAASVNAYDYCWRAKPTAAQAMEEIGGNKYIISKSKSKSNSTIATTNHYNQDEFESGQGKKSDFYYTGCKEQRRSLFWEPYCIATT